VMKLPPRPILSPDLLGAVSTDILFDFIAVRLDSSKAIGKRWQVNWNLSDRDEKVCHTLSNETLTQLMGKVAKAPAATVTTTREVLVGLIVGKVSVADAVTSGALGIDGDRAVIEDLFDMLDTFGMQFDILTPGPGVPGPD